MLSKNIFKFLFLFAAVSSCVYFYPSSFSTELESNEELTWGKLKLLTAKLSKEFELDFSKLSVIKTAIPYFEASDTATISSMDGLKSFLLTGHFNPEGLVSRKEFIVFLFLINFEISEVQKRTINRDFDPEKFPNYSDVGRNPGIPVMSLNIWGINPWMSSKNLIPAAPTLVKEAGWAFDQIIHFHSNWHQLWYGLKFYIRAYSRKLKEYVRPPKWVK